MKSLSPPRQKGFTMVEAIMVIVITGIIAGMVALFIRAPVQGYFDSARRAELTDITDTALRRIERDVHLALPNSIRTPNPPNPNCFEFLPTTVGGRYRAAGPGNELDFTTADSSFDVLGNLSPVPAANDRVVVYNLGIPGADAYNGDNSAAILNAAANSITLTAATLFPFASPSARFHVIPNTAVFYVCNNPNTDAAGNGTGTLFRWTRAINSAPLAACPVPPAGTPILAQNVSVCNFTYTPGVTQRSGLLSLTLGISLNAEQTNLYHQVHVNNVP